MNDLLKSQTRRVSRQAFMILTALIWTRTVLIDYVKAVILRLPLIKNFADECILLAFLVVIFFALPNFQPQLPDIFFIIISVSVYMLEWLFYQSGSIYFSMYASDFLLKSLPLYIVGVSLASMEEDYKEILYKLLYILSVLTLFFDIIYHLLVRESMTYIESLYEGNMSLAYNLLPHCCYISWHAVRKAKPWSVILCVISALYLLLLGTRGAALINLLFIAIAIVAGKDIKKSVVKALVIGCIFGGFLSSHLYETTLRWLETLAKRLGLSVRIFERLLNGGISDSNGRDKIRERVLMKIHQRPAMGNGMYSDRVLLGGTYSHNIVLELWIDFGVIFGTLLLATLIFILFRGYVKEKNINEKGMILSLTSATLLKLFLSGSWLNESFLFLVLGLSVGAIRMAHKSK
jgi:O-antigen ligase